MTSGSANEPANIVPRAHTMSFQGAANRLVRGLLRTPLISRGIGRTLVTLYLVGRKSGRHRTIPVAYVAHEGALLFGTPFPWGRNLRTGDPVAIRLLGKLRTADVEVFREEADVVRLYTVMMRANRNFAKFNQVGFDASGEPIAQDLHLAWAAGARAFRLTPR